MPTHRLALALSLVVLVAASKAGALDESARLRTGILPSPEVTLSSSDVLSPTFPRVRLDKYGNVGPKNYVSLEKTRSHTITIAGNGFILQRQGGSFALKVPGGGSAKLRRKGAGFQPIPLALPGRRKYMLVFPMTSTSSIAYRSGTVQKGKVGGKDLTLYDDNTDGFYTTDDTFQVGRSLVFAPIDGHFATSSSVYELGDISRDGSQVTYSGYSGDTGKLSLRCNAAALVAHVAFGSKDADLNLVLTSSGRPVKVIPGSYALLYGLAYSSTKRKVCAGIVPGDLAPTEVTKGGSTKAMIGGPFRLEFTHGVQGNKLTVSPSTIKLKGNAGEEYVSFKWQGAPRIKITSGSAVLSAGSMEYG